MKAPFTHNKRRGTPTEIFSLINYRNIDSVKRVLADGHPLAVGIPVFKSKNDQPATLVFGNYLMPLGKDNFEGFHCLVVVGYYDDPKLPGGGALIIRNSHGKNWGRACRYGIGYGTLPYDYIVRYNLSAYYLIIDKSNEHSVIRDGGVA